MGNVSYFIRDDGIFVVIANKNLAFLIIFIDLFSSLG